MSAPFEGDIGEPNSFGGYLVLLFGAVMGMFLYEKDGAKRFRWAVLLVMILAPLAFTESRSSYLAFAVMMVMFITLSEHKRLLIVGMLAGLTMAPFVTPQNVIDRVMFTFEQPEEAGQIIVAGAAIDTSTSDRIGQWIKVLTVDFPKHPLLGLGVTGGSFMDAQYPRVLSETGLIGLFAFVWLLYRLWLLLKICHKGLYDDRLRGLALGVQCGLAGLMVHALGANTFTIVRVMEPLMILVGLITAALLVQQNQEALKKDEPDASLAEAQA